jgi:hypothetical protein
VAHRKWFPQPKDIQNLTHSKVRDLITKCFFEAHKETFADASRFFGHPPPDDDLHRTIVGIVRVAFRETNHSYEHPTREALQEVAQFLVRKAAVWRAPVEVVEHNREQIGKLLEALP